MADRLRAMEIVMIGYLFESRYRRERDRAEISSLRNEFGDEARRIARQRAASALDARSRRHWSRLAQKIRLEGFLPF